jgi:trehalose-6-phosphatase
MLQLLPRLTSSYRSILAIATGPKENESEPWNGSRILLQYGST